MDKENTRVKIISKIPVPKEPLPPLPQALIKTQQKVDNERPPLKTLSGPTVHPNLNGAIQKGEKVHPKPKCPLNIATRYVTHRQNNEDLDWNYHVFIDSTLKDDNQAGNDNEAGNDKQAGNYNQAGNYLVNNHETNCLGEAKKSITPALKSPSLEPNRIKNIKRSLKRPHSRELQGLSPKLKQDRGDERHKRRLEFTEPSGQRLQSSDFLEKLYIQYTNDMYTYLLCREKNTNKPRIPNKTRACLINWLMRINGLHGNPAVVQSALWYFDAVLTASEVPYESLQVVAAACFWIAQKTHGQAYSVRRLVRLASEAFDSNYLKAAEKAVLFKLKYPTHPIIPQDFITYLSCSCETKPHGEIERAATFLCMAGMIVDKALCEHYPSAIAAASVRDAVLLLGKKDALVKLHMNSMYKKANKKTPCISPISSIQRNAIRCMSSSDYKYTALLEYYRGAPHYIAEKIINSDNF